ncbi:MAG: NAD-dependent epimerase/dehydratase family protein [bacterium]
MKVLVTGGGGFLGRAIVEQLLDRGDDVTIIARSDYPEIRALGAKTVQGDLADKDACAKAVDGQDAVIHTAAKAGVWGKKEDYERSNIEATRNVLNACFDKGVGRLVLTSTPSVTFDGTDAEGAGQDLPYPATFLTHYPQTKAHAEKLVLTSNGPNLATTALRPHLIWGPRDPHLVPRVVESARKKKLKIVGDGRNRVDLTYVDNGAVAHLQALDALTSHEAPNAGKPYFIADGEPVVLWEWINTLLGRLDVPPVRGHVSPDVAYKAGAVLELVYRTLRLSGEPRMTRFVAQQLSTSHWYDMEPARRDFGYTPIVNPDDGFERLVAWMKSV